jgi:polysaccharide deacetylase family protein (PEP-CTERM system associated)
LCNSKNLLEDIIGAQVYGYRAPSFAINNDILKIIEECGYLYDSSYNSFALHSRYGHLDLSRNGQRGIALQIPKTRNPDFIGKHETRNRKHETFYELPISNINVFKSVLPWGGGAYFRLIPFPIFRLGVQSILKKENAYLFYFHPWEIDPEQPRMNEVSIFYKFRHYINLKKTHSKLSKLITEFCHCRFTNCKQYLSQIF